MHALQTCYFTQLHWSSFQYSEKNFAISLEIFIYNGTIFYDDSFCVFVCRGSSLIGTLLEKMGSREKCCQKWDLGKKR